MNSLLQTEYIRAPVRATENIHFAEDIWLGLRDVQPRTYVSDPFFMIRLTFVIKK